MNSADMILVRNQTGVNIAGGSFPEPILPSAVPIVSSDAASSPPSPAFASAGGKPDRPSGGCSRRTHDADHEHG